MEELLCGCDDIVAAIREMGQALGIPKSLQAAGLAEERVLGDLEHLVQDSLIGATRFNPVKMNPDNMRDLLRTAYYGF